MSSKWIDRIYIGGFLSLLIGLLLFFIFEPKTIFSELENRKLQENPEFSWSRIWSQQYAKDAELYVTDHFPFRAEFIATKSLLEQARLQKENNGIFLGEDGYLFEKFGKTDLDELGSYVDAINKFAANHPETRLSFLLAPNSVGMYPERLPWMAEAYSQRELNKWIGGRLDGGLTFLDGFAFLDHGDTESKQDDRQLYYRTDHHWTTFGAYLAYRAYSESLGWEPLEEEDFHIRTVTDSFLGSYHTKGQYGGLRPDAIEVYEPKNPVASEMHIVDTDETKDSLYDDSYLGKKDKYSYFQGGVHALVTITNEIASEDADLEKLLIVKDSYAHSMLPFLTNHVKEIHMIDIRYYNGNIGDYMEENGIQDALFLFNTSTFVQERNLLKLKY